MTLSSSADALSLSLQRVATSQFTGLRSNAQLGLFDSRSEERRVGKECER